VTTNRNQPGPGGDITALSISEITRDIRRTLNQSFDDIRVRGEISGFKRHGPSGHVYFNLKDENAVLSCAMWRMVAGGLRFDAADGMEVEARGNIDVYPRTGRYQLIVRELLPAGQGALLLALEALRRKLAGEGLFDEDRKRPLPRYPTRIALVTSPTGAAVRDLLDVMGRRWPLAEVVLAPVPVQGEGAAEKIAASIDYLNHWGWPEVLIVGRGGGSLEDLWAFNEEILVRAVAASEIPVVSAVGHEVDHTLCDAAADLRAPTPSAAAELATPDATQVGRAIGELGIRAGVALERLLEDRSHRLARARRSYGLRRPLDVLGQHAQERDRLLSRLFRAAQGDMRERRQRANLLAGAYGLRILPGRIRDLEERIQALGGRLSAGVGHLLEGRRRASESAGRHLKALSPRGVLGRGYSLVRGEDGTLVRSYQEIRENSVLTIELARGGARTRVEKVLAPEEVEKHVS
jgi:exodeoxyribonuclease VII large subunit